MRVRAPETSGELDRGVIRAGSGGLATFNLTWVVITLNFAGLDDFFCMLITVHNFGKILFAVRGWGGRGGLVPGIALGLRTPSESQAPCEATDQLFSMTEEGTGAYTGEGACPKGRSRQSGPGGG